MKIYAFFLLVVATVYCDNVNLLEKFASANNRFSADVYKEIKKTESGNFLFCPLSAEIILALTRVGSRGNTARQLSKGLHLSDDTNEIEQIFKELTSKLKSDKGYTLNSANKIYLNQKYEIRESFKTTAQNSFSADITSVDFNMKTTAANEINEWVSEQTHNNIKDVVGAEIFTAATVGVLVNALYFKSTWVTEFHERATQRKPFYFNINDHVDVDMMEVTDYYKYFKSDKLKAKFLEMPYVGDRYSMVFVLPYEKDGLEQLEYQLEDVFDISPRYKVKVHVQVPKFKTEFKVELTDILKYLGIKDAFEDDADLIGFTTAGPGAMKISSVVQKAVIEVDEKETTAAAATNVHVINSLPAVPAPIEEFNADHPFLYYIKGPSGVMFIGRYVQK